LSEAIFLELLSNRDNVIILSRSEKELLLRWLGSNGILAKAKLVDNASLFVTTKDDFISYMFDKHHLSPEFSSRLVNYFDPIETEKTYHFEKAKQLQVWKNELLNQGLLTLPSFDFVHGKTVWVSEGLDLPKAFSTHVSEIHTFQFLPVVETLIECFTSKDYESQIESVISKVTELLKNKVKPESIHLMNVTDKDEFYLTRWFDEANIPIDNMSMTPLTRIPLCISFLKRYKTDGIEKAIEFLNLTEYETSLWNEKAVSSIFSVLNRYSDKELDSLVDLIEYELRNVSVKIKERKGITLERSMNLYLDKSDVHLIMNYNDSFLPKVMTDQDYFFDREKEIIGLRPSREINLLEERRIKSLLEQMTNCTVFFQEREGGSIYQMPNIQLKRGYRNQGRIPVDYSYFPSKAEIYNKVQNHGFQDLESGYNPSFKPISDRLINRLIDHKVRISATSMESYLSCPFKYLLQYLLKMDSFEESFPLFYGNLAHKLIETQSKSNDFNISDIISSFMKDFPDPIKKEVYFPILVHRMEQTLKALKDIRSQSDFYPIASELSISKKYPQDPRFEITGKIDQVFKYETEDLDYYAIVDYKTGSIQFDIEKIKTQKQVQLLMYAYLFNQSLSDIRHQISGLYFQKAGLPKSTLPEKISEYFSYDGISLKNKQMIEKFAPYSYLKKVSLKSDNTLKESSRLMDSLELNELIENMNRKLDQVIQKIKNGSFEIEPEVVAPGKKESPSCEYCSFQNICFMANHLVFKDTSIEEEVVEDEE